MKVLLDGHMLGRKKTGIERYWKNLTTHLLSSPKDIDLSIYSNIDKSYFDNNKLKKNSFENLKIYKPLINNGLYRITWDLAQAIDKIRPDILHTSYFTPLVKTVPIVNTVHDICFLLCPESADLKSRIAFNFFFKQSLKNTDIFICPSMKVKQDLIKEYDIPKEKIHVIYEAAEDCFFYIKDKKEVKTKLRSKFQIDSQYFLVVGNVDSRKRPMEIVEAYTELSKENRKIQLVFAGPNLLKKNIFAKYIDLVEKKKILFLDYVSDLDLNLLYNSALALIYYSKCEGFGLPLVEAMACRTQIICSDQNVFREICNKAALYIESEKELYNKMQFLLKDQFIEYSKYSHYRNNFSWLKNAKKTLDLYNELLELRKISNSYENSI